MVTKSLPEQIVRRLCSEPALSVVIVTFNCLQQIQNCLRSMPARDGSLNYELIIVDNDSHDGTPEWIQDSHPEARLISNRVNRGFASACNQGIAVARSKYILLLNPDTIVVNGAFGKTVAYMERSPQLAACTCKVLLPSGKIDPSCKRDFPSPWDAFCRMTGVSRMFPNSHLLARYDAKYLDEDEQQEVPLIDGCYMVIRKNALDQIGLLDERFFMYAEEMDWCRRAHLMGWSIGYDPSGTIIHVKGDITRHWPFRCLYHFHRSMALYYRKHHGRRNPLQLVVYSGIALRMVLLVLLNLFRSDRRVSG